MILIEAMRMMSKLRIEDGPRRFAKRIIRNGRHVHEIKGYNGVTFSHTPKRQIIGKIPGNLSDVALAWRRQEDTARRTVLP
jgi:hypothetical protein